MESKLKAVRRGHRGQVTKLLKTFDEIENNSDLDKDDVKLISDAIEQKQRTIVDLKEKILDLTSEEDSIAEKLQIRPSRRGTIELSAFEDKEKNIRDLDTATVQQQTDKDEKDRDFTRFFGLSDTDNPSSTLTAYRFKSILFGSTSLSFILNATLLQHLDVCNTNISAMMKNNLYVDNILSSLENEDDAAKYFVQARSLMSEAGFSLRSWSSNCSKLTDLAKQA
ncbi:Hypothetical predicted protein [Mytilus galloprovincialis]|uniref:Uncharacterized protein n=1 Tax=Mytilus galloprovincialis TaxID=29158 RepID=A0A8B6FVQ0_MYTGA|nr:Hypothetical predicted protein [Mytilus galloprovincialis]